MLVDEPKRNRFGLTEADIALNRAFIARLPKQRVIKTEVDKKPVTKKKTKIKTAKKKPSPSVKRHIDFIVEKGCVSNLDIVNEFGTRRIYHKHFRESILSCGRIKYDFKSKVFHTGEKPYEQFHKKTVRNNIIRFIRDKKVVNLSELRKFSKSARATVCGIKKSGLIKTIAPGVYKWCGS